MYPIIAGVQFDGKQYQFNYDSNNANDILELVSLKCINLISITIFIGSGTSSILKYPVKLEVNSSKT